MLSDFDKRALNALDEAAERAGGYLAPPKRPFIQDYDYRMMSRYCRDKGVTSDDLTEEELKMFRFDPPLVYN